MPITFDRNRKTIRRTTAEYQFTDDNGEIRTEEIGIEYYSLTTAAIKRQIERDLQRQKDNPDEPSYYTDILVDRLHALPDLIDPETKKPIEITVENLDAMALENLTAITDAIKNDADPKSQPGS